MRAPDFWARDGALARLLAPLGMGYDLAGRLARAAVRPVTAPVPVVCVGNLTAGGAGKTPVVISLLQSLSKRGIAAHCLTRGYGGRAAGPLRVDRGRHAARDVGDEALIIARAAPTWVARDRVAGARAAAEAGAAAIVMDDGFQNPSLFKDLSLLVIDGGYGFGNARVMPAGPLRETVPRGLARADALVVLGTEERILARSLNTGLPALGARLVPGPEGQHLAGQRVLAFAGIGRPEKFFATLEALGAELVETRSYPDHHPYSTGEIEALLARAKDQNARAVTTEKDAVRLPAELSARVEALPVTLEWRDEDAVEALLDRVFAAPARQLDGRAEAAKPA